MSKLLELLDIINENCDWPGCGDCKGLCQLPGVKGCPWEQIIEEYNRIKKEKK